MAPESAHGSRKLSSCVEPTVDDIEEWLALVARQQGIVTRRQVLGRGLTDDVIRAHIEARRWRRVGTGAYSTTTGPLTREAEHWAAVLACWPCALSHDTAAEVHGLRPPSASTTTHVTRPYGLSVVRTSGVEVHRSRAFEHLTVPGATPPIVTMAHTALDLAVAEPSARAAMRSLLRSLVTTRLSPSTVHAAIELRRPRRWKQALLDALDYAEGGVTSALEARWTLDVERAHGLPAPERQVPTTVDGVQRLEDLVYRGRAEEVIVRLDGRRFHAVESVTVIDRRRANAAELSGRRQLVYGWPEVTDSPCVAAREVALALDIEVAARGRCPRECFLVP